MDVSPVLSDSLSCMLLSGLRSPWVDALCPPPILHSGAELNEVKC